MTPQRMLVPFNKLVASPANVRHVKTDLAPLVASLRADGILQNLIVVQRDDGRYEVIAGERRRRAAGVLVKEGAWPRTQPIPCEARTRSDATAVSFAENAERVAMHPADAYRAFAALAAEGHDETAIAHRYGYDVGDVVKLLRLGSLIPQALKALADDRIDVSFAQALTLTDDPELQESVLKRARSTSEARRLLTTSKVSIRHRLYRFVADRYGPAGGAITRDLFSSEGEGYADDGELVQKLVGERLETLAAAARDAGWSEVIASESAPHEVYRLDHLSPSGRREPTPDELAEIERLDAVIEGISSSVATDAATSEERDRLWKARRRREEILGAGRIYTPEDRAGGLMVITIDPEGGVRESFYARRVSRKARIAQEERPLYPATLVERMSRLRTIALQLEVARQPALALDIIVDALLGMMPEGARSAHAIELRPERFRLGDAGDVPAGEEGPRAAVADLLGTLPSTPAARWAWIGLLTMDDKMRLLAYATARLLNGTVGKFADTDRLACFERIAAAAGLDMTAHWTADAAFFVQLTRRACLAALGEGAGRVDEAWAKLGKQALAAVCAERLAGTGWLPMPLRAIVYATEEHTVSAG